MATDYLALLMNDIESSSVRYDTDLIRRAFLLAEQAHGNQMRLSGEPYIVHPVEVARILCSYESDTQTIAAALLHDVVEDTEKTLDDIEAEFGKDVSLLVDGVTKLGKLSFSTKEQQQIENIRKMLLAMTKDIRVILIKLADRLHNMRTLASQTPAKQREKALESLEVYAPLAHRLGIQHLKSELEDLSLQYLDPIGYDEIVENLKVFHENDNMFNEIRELIETRMAEMGVEGSIKGRIKHIYSIYRKMFNQNKSFNEIYDLYAFRIIVDQTPDCYNVLGQIHDLFRAIPGRLKDYIATPKPNMYRSLHTTVSYKGYLFEVQIRTWEMHRVAEMGIAAHWKYKSGEQASSSDDAKLEWIGRLLELQKEVDDPDDFIKMFKIDLFSDQVFVATPKGDIINMPANSTVIDFAYTIHSAVGNKMVGAKINGRIVELTAKMHNGDVVEILTSENSPGPSRDWLKIVNTNEAKNKIRAWFKREKRDENILHGREDLERELRRNQINLANITREELYASVMKRYAMPSVEEFYAAIGYGGIMISKILPKIKDDYTKYIKQRQKDGLEIKINHGKSKGNGIVVEGIDNCLVRLAGCCSPLPGDPIIGFITRGYGVTVHHADCVNVATADKERVIPVMWETATSDYFATDLAVTAVNRIDLIADISTTLASLRISMHSLQTQELPDNEVTVTLSTEVHDIGHLDSVIAKLRKINGVMRVNRVKK